MCYEYPADGIPRGTGEACTGLTWAGVLQGEVLISKLGAIDGLASCAVARSEVSALQVDLSTSEGAEVNSTSGRGSEV